MAKQGIQAYSTDVQLLIEYIPPKGKNQLAYRVVAIYTDGQSVGPMIASQKKIRRIQSLEPGGEIIYSHSRLYRVTMDTNHQLTWFFRPIKNPDGTTLHDGTVMVAKSQFDDALDELKKTTHMIHTKG